MQWFIRAALALALVLGGDRIAHATGNDSNIDFSGGYAFTGGCSSYTTPTGRSRPKCDGDENGSFLVEHFLATNCAVNTEATLRAFADNLDAEAATGNVCTETACSALTENAPNDPAEWTYPSLQVVSKDITECADAVTGPLCNLGASPTFLIKDLGTGSPCDDTVTPGTDDCNGKKIVCKVQRKVTGCSGNSATDIVYNYGQFVCD